MLVPSQGRSLMIEKEVEKLSVEGVDLVTTDRQQGLFNTRQPRQWLTHQPHPPTVITITRD
jgi:hypothetical protein